ncbi:PREDICTED: centrosomal protein of 85 kDa-like isoform X3 [Cyprinodon variegatus]|uniref:centrosomal protein of 85 kDa-like isoform X3 n=1 Tax=Cyprinodon variegatus TaxID=28743 RepID=UPI0007427DB5|nr:PREDICTED: centrosomal protein of 85 kDa-like isoform X3 [Cyprinodon variegatus]
MMWNRSDAESGPEGPPAGSSCGSVGWALGHESTWQGSLLCSGSRVCSGRRQSTVSDGGDTGIGTYCSDSLEDDSSSSMTPLSTLLLSQQEEDGLLSATMSSPSSSPGVFLKMSSSSHSLSCWNRSCEISKPLSSTVEAQSSTDRRGHPPIRRSLSFTKLSSGVEKSSMKTSCSVYSTGAQGSLDRGMLYGYRRKNTDSKVKLHLPLSSSTAYSSALQRSPGSHPSCGLKHSSRSPGLRRDPSPSSSHSSPVKHSCMCNSLHGGGQQGHWVDRPIDTPIQPAVRTQMWLNEQMEYQPKLDPGTEPGENGGVDAFSLLHQEPGLQQQTLRGRSIPANTLLRVKEKLLRERELEIQSQKLQILQLQVWIKENEQRAQQVLVGQRGPLTPPNAQEAAVRTSCRAERLGWEQELGEKLAAAELEVLHLDQFFKQVILKYKEERRKLEEKIKTRDRYITSLKKKCQRESEQNQERQQRIETLEKYLSDLPTPGQVQVQSKQDKLEETKQHLENTVLQLQRSIEEGCALIQRKDALIEMQAKTENQLMASVQSLRKKVQQCLDDGVRLPVQDFKMLKGENSQLLQQHRYSNRVLRMQEEEIERLTSQLTDQGKAVEVSSPGRMSEVEQLLEEMSLCLFDLRGFCSILAHRAQGKEANLSLLLGMKSISVSADQPELQAAAAGEELSSKLLEVGLLRRGIDELRRTMAERCPNVEES